VRLDDILAIFRGSKQPPVIDASIIGVENAAFLERCIGTPGVVVNKAAVTTKRNDSAKYMAALIKFAIQKKEQRQQTTKPTFLPVDRTERIQWSDKQVLQRIGMRTRLGFAKTQAIYEAILKLSTKEALKKYRLVRRSAGRVRVVSITGEHETRAGALKVTGDFFNVGGQTEFLLQLDGLPAVLRNAILASAMSPRAALSLRFGNASLYLSSRKLLVGVSKSRVRLAPGPNLAVAFQPGANVLAALGRPDELILAGPLWFESGKAAPTFDLTTYPPCTLKLGPLALHRAHVAVRSGWATDPGDMPDTWVDSNPGDPVDISGVQMVEVGLAGYCVVSQNVRVRLWSSLPADNGVLVFNRYEGSRMEKNNIDSLSELDDIAGGSDWRTAFPVQDFLAAAAPWAIRNVTPFHDLSANALSSLTIEVTSRRDIALPGLRDFVLRNFTLTFVISHPTSTRRIYITGKATLLAEGLEFDAALDVRTMSINASAENGKLAQSAVARASFLRDLQVTVAGPDDAVYTDFYLHLAATDRGYVVNGFAAANDDGAEREWQRR
jgi:hypothetical protein